MVSPLDPTYGVAFITLFLATMQDKWGVKTTVVCLLIFETMQIVLYFDGLYLNLIDDFGNPMALDTIFWQGAATLLFGYLSTFLVQMYFGYCVYILNPKNKFISAVIILLGLTSLGTAIALTVRTSNSIITTLMINAVNRGALTALCAALNMILFLAKPGTLYFFLGLIPSGKLYMNSMLATLNTRQHLRSKGKNSQGMYSLDAIAGESSQNRSLRPNHVFPNPGVIVLYTTTETAKWLTV
ncbi:hypothetical protein DFH08DRAFT_1083184 [Mycena albidolilacea]|uniref:DUF6534 domain-containing protein n=1 Tax=Mycena albidolilacea TaxID=1033008 RepID=A0AAD6ZRU9_9AGAR|nr:hypothetical protein DFH08DRAFT_1083184 [Mycena albidolilacea]